MEKIKLNKKAAAIFGALFLLSNVALPQIITVKSGTYLNGGSAMLNTNGSWNNSGNFNPGSGTVTFEGASGHQMMSNNGQALFNNIIINKVSGEVSLNRDIDIIGNLTLTRGTLNLNGKNITLGRGAALIESNGNIVTRDSGTIKTSRTLNSPNSFNVAGLGAEITSASNLGGTEIIRGHQIQIGAGNYGIRRYYDINPSNDDNLNATLVFHYDDSELNGADETKLELFKSTDKGVTWKSMGGTVDTANNTVTLSGINSFSRWTLGSATSPLPVELTTFTASINGNNVILKWQTATEVNNNGFEVEREILKQVQNDSWEKIGFVAGAGNSNSPKSYSFTDQPMGGTTFSYRLKQIDNDGKFKYYDAITVNLTAGQKAELIGNYPNPFNPSTAIKYYIPNNSEVTIKIYDMLGREVNTLINKQSEAGYHIVYWNGMDRYGNSAASGVYLYKLSATGEAGSFNETKKMLLMK